MITLKTVYLKIGKKESEVKKLMQRLNVSSDAVKIIVREPSKENPECIITKTVIEVKKDLVPKNFITELKKFGFK